MHTAKLCAATEPEVPGRPAPGPYPPPAAPGAGQEGILLGISDTGLWEQPSSNLHPWLNGVEGKLDPPGPTLANGQPSIPYEGGHGTMVAGVARCTAPGARVYVGRHFPYSGGALEYELASELETLIDEQHPDLINLSAGGYTRGDAPPLSFTEFRQRHPDVTLVTAAGNDSTDRPFWPAAFDWAIAVGALGADLENLAWFSNYGNWVDVYALGEGVVNAFASGVYTYQRAAETAGHAGLRRDGPVVGHVVFRADGRRAHRGRDGTEPVVGRGRLAGGAQHRREQRLRPSPVPALVMPQARRRGGRRWRGDERRPGRAGHRTGGDIRG